MGSNPINLLLRFFLELSVLVSVGYYGWTQFTFPVKLFSTIIPIFILLTIWGVFAVPNDPSRSGKTVIKTSGIIRLLIEITFFMIGYLALHFSNQILLSNILASTTLVHYIISYDRILWLIKQ